jgi:hypothetical protein
VGAGEGRLGDEYDESYCPVHFMTSTHVAHDKVEANTRRPNYGPEYAPLLVAPKITITMS